MEFGIGLGLLLTLYILCISGTVFYSPRSPLETDQAFSCLELAVSNMGHGGHGHH